MKISEIKEGVYIRWVANRIFNSWDTYGVITKVEGDDVTIVTFDTHKETTISMLGEAIKEEISVVTTKEVKRMFENQTLSLKHAREKHVVAHQQALENLDIQIQNLIDSQNSFLSTIS